MKMCPGTGVEGNQGTVASKLALSEDALGLMAGGWGGNWIKRDLEQDHWGLVKGAANNRVELEYSALSGCSG